MQSEARNENDYAAAYCAGSIRTEHCLLLAERYKLRVDASDLWMAGGYKFVHGGGIKRALVQVARAGERNIVCKDRRCNGRCCSRVWGACGDVGANVNKDARCSAAADMRMKVDSIKQTAP